jgi:hypothetical protein
MCNCKNCNGNGNPIAVAFKDQQPEIATVFARYGMGHMQVTPQNALIGVQAHGAQFAKDLALAAAGLNTSYANGTDQEKTDLAASIFEIFGTAANAGINIAQGVIAIKNGQNAPQQPQPGAPTIVYQPPQQPQPEAKKIGGFTVGQIALLGAAVLMIIGAVVFLNSKES